MWPPMSDLAVQTTVCSKNLFIRGKTSHPGNRPRAPAAAAVSPNDTTPSLHALRWTPWCFTGSANRCAASAARSASEACVPEGCSIAGSGNCGSGLRPSTLTWNRQTRPSACYTAKQSSATLHSSKVVLLMCPHGAHVSAWCKGTL